MSFEQYIDSLNLNFPDRNHVKNAMESSSLFLSTNLILNFLNELKKNNLICMDSVYHSMDEIVMFDHWSFTLNITENKRTSLLKCIKNDLVVIPIGISSPLLPENIKHLNIILIDTKTNSIEYYEPFGKENNIFNLMLIDVSDLIVKKICDIFNISNYTYINTGNLCQYGLQRVDDPKSYRCGVWCMFVLYLKIYNRNLKIHDIHNILTSKLAYTEISGHTYLGILITKFMTFIEVNYKNNNMIHLVNSYNLLDEYILKDESKTQEILNYLKLYTIKYLNDIEKNNPINPIEYRYNFYNLIVFNKMQKFHSTIEEVLKNNMSNLYFQGFLNGQKQYKNNIKNGLIKDIQTNYYNDGFRDGYNQCLDNFETMSVCSDDNNSDNME